MDSLSDFDQRRIEELHALILEEQDILYEIERKLLVETRPLERRRLAQDADQVRVSYNRHCKEYADLLRKEIPTWFATGDQALIYTVVQRLDADQLAVTHTALQEVDRDPNNSAFAQLLAEVAAVLPSMQQQLAAKHMPAANQIAQVAHVLQAPTADLKQKLKLSIPLIPLFLAYETEFNLNFTASLKAAWERLKERFRPS